MKQIILSILLFITTGICAAQPPKKAVFVIVDGIAADVIEKLNTPHLDAIARQGGFTRAHVGGNKNSYSQTPTISAVGYNSLLTGTWVNKHNVWDNDIKAPNYHYWTIFRFLKEQYPQKKAAVFSSWEDNRTKLVGENLPATGNLTLDYHFDGLEHDTVKYPHDKNRDFMHRIDEAVADNAAEYIKTQAPDLSWVYLEYTDDMGHKYGDSPQFFNAVEMMDAQMGRLWAAIQYREQKFKEDWVIYITTDHGRDAATGRDHGGQSDRERSTWIVTNARQLNTYFKTGNPGIVDIMPSLANHLGINIPKERRMEIDGVSLVGPVCAVTPSAILKEQRLQVQWKALSSKGNARIWLAVTDEFNRGGTDHYKLVATVPLSRQEVFIELKERDAEMCKVVIETPCNLLNTWWVKDWKKIEASRIR